ncbi:hypothetical protein COV16_04875, partial [Candidatus Woesearchaeota archaeon CG10_big_fil_rev_8_21_14_0_10_34_8]
KSVFFVTGNCSCTCFYCPISDMKKGNDIMYINEMPSHNKKEIIREIELCGSKGIGITGGDPLAVYDRTAQYIKTCKKRFGKKFHVHLYTTPKLLDKKRLDLLFSSGLDEIRLHPSLESKSYWHKISLVLPYLWDIGIEIPSIPGYTKITKELLDYVYILDVKKQITFVNLNELEIADNSFSTVRKRGYKTTSRISYAIKGSDTNAKEIMNYILNKKYHFAIHFCTARLKDKIQMTKRIQLRAEHIKLSTDIVSREGMLIRGVLYLKEICPGVHYRKHLEELSEKEKQIFRSKIELLKQKIGSMVPCTIDPVKFRILLSKKDVLKHKKFLSTLGCEIALVEEYPTYDGFEVEVEFLTSTKPL